MARIYRIDEGVVDLCQVAYISDWMPAELFRYNDRAGRDRGYDGGGCIIRMAGGTEHLCKFTPEQVLALQQAFTDHIESTGSDAAMVSIARSYLVSEVLALYPLTALSYPQPQSQEILALLGYDFAAHVDHAGANVFLSSRLSALGYVQ